jgi:hypothetical protein
VIQIQFYMRSRSIWWRRRELNPRPRVIQIQFYMRSRSI